jgi:hypothetical protein
MSRLLTSLLLAGALLPCGAAAQGWTAVLDAGRIEHAVPGEGERVLSGGLRYTGSGASWGYVTGGLGLVPAPRWGAVGLGSRLGRASAPIGIDMGGHLFAYGGEAAGRGGLVEVLPMLAFRGGGLRMEARAGVVGFARHGETDWRRAGVESGLRAAAAGGRLRAKGDVKVLGLAGEVLPRTEAAVELDLARVTLFTSLGRWWSEVEIDDVGPVRSTVGASAGIRVGVPGGAVLQTGWRRDPADPLLGVDERSAWTVALSTPVGRRARPIPRLRPDRRGEVVLTIPDREVPAGGVPQVMGDFTGWEPVAMQRGPGTWKAAFRLRPGVYHFALRSAAGEWFLPAGWPSVDDGFGGRSAVLVVEDQSGVRAAG